MNHTDFLHVSPRNIQVLNQHEFANLGSDPSTLSNEQLQYFSVFGLLAPTSHNSVPERFRFSENRNELELWLDRKFVLTQSDPEGKQATISLGCVVQNIEEVAEFYGYSTEFSLKEFEIKNTLPLTGSGEQFVHMLTLSFERFSSDDQKKVSRSPQILIDRKVIRTQYDEQAKLDESTSIQLLTHHQQHYPQVTLNLYASKTDLHAIGKYQEDGDRTVFEDPDFTYELGTWLLENDDTLHPYGMRGREFGFDDEFAKKIHQGFLQKESLLPDQIAAFARGGKVAMENASAVAILSLENDTIENRVLAGKAYQEIGLTLFERGYAHSIHAAITEVEWVRSLFSATFLRSNNKPVVVFRIGKPKRPESWKREHSFRPTLAEVLL